MKVTAAVLNSLYHPPEKDRHYLTWRFNPKIKRRRMPIYILEFHSHDRTFLVKRGVRDNPWRTYNVENPKLLDLLKSRLSSKDIAECIRSAILDDGIPF